MTKNGVSLIADRKTQSELYSAGTP